MDNISPNVRLSDTDPSLARIEFGNGGYRARLAARVLLSIGTYDSGFEYIPQRRGGAEHVVWGTTKEAGETIEPYLGEIQSEADQAVEGIDAYLERKKAEAESAKAERAAACAQKHSNS